MSTEATQHDEMNAKYFSDGWEAALREVIAVDKHQGPEAAVSWAKEHSSEMRRQQDERGVQKPLSENRGN